MTELEIRKILSAVQSRKATLDEAMEKLKHFPYENLGFARIDHHRSIRQGFPEVIFGRGKTVKQITTIVEKMLAKNHNVLVTRTDERVFRQIRKLSSRARFHPDSGAISIVCDKTLYGKGEILVVSAGTADIPVAEEASVTAEIMGNSVTTLFDVGVAGLHRLLSQYQRLKKARVIIVVAGMEGALPSVVGGLVSVPVIAVPTSIGYGASLGGVTALLSMLNSCASNVTVVNIDNGFGAGFVASLINRL
ncbi:MAG TPA: nickel pincer cofactor biosynthesis protein LarB [Terriglobia bacterium]|nr:nickel pincer cofactor biosynthesis protein LarB [Terriglobia bacterium]